jgi:D-sedoheptulose 7-phosphate isomerase
MVDVDIYLEAARAALAAIDPEPVAKAAELCLDCVMGGGKILFCGNGGSAADSQHFAGELVGRFRLERGAIPAIALTADTAVITSLANDYSFEMVFARQVEALGRAGDVLVAITTSGRSPNVLMAIEKAHGLGLRVVAFTGSSGGPAADAADVAVRAPSGETSHAQEALLVAGHAICAAVERGYAAASCGAQRLEPCLADRRGLHG